MKYFLALSLASFLAAPAHAQNALEQAEAQVRDSLEGPKIRGDERTTGVEPGYLGVRADDHGSGDGVRIESVLPGGPADKGGLQAGDLITAIEGQPMRSLDDFAAQLAHMPAGAKVAFDVRRGDGQRSVEVVLGRRQTSGQPPAQLRLGPSAARDASTRPAPLGIRVQPVAAGAEPGQPEARGMRVTKVIKNSTADKAGIAVGDVIVAIDGQEIDSPDQAAELLAQVRVGQTLQLSLSEGGQLYDRAMMIEADRSLAAPGLTGTFHPAQPLRSAPQPGPTEELVEGSAERVERLERRIVDLEKRLADLQRSMDRLSADAQRKP
jgi:S1-C subfamily serine protease